MTSSVHVDNRGKNILILGKGPTQGLNHTLTAEAKYPTNFPQSGERFVLSVHYNRSVFSRYPCMRYLPNDSLAWCSS